MKLLVCSIIIILQIISILAQEGRGEIGNRPFGNNKPRRGQGQNGNGKMRRGNLGGKPGNAANVGDKHKYVPKPVGPGPLNGPQDSKISVVGGFKPIKEYEDAKQVQDFFKKFYNSEEICTKPAKTLSYRNRGAGEGLGSLLNGFMITAMHALVRGKRLCAHEANTTYTNAQKCKSQTWDCLFETISPACPCVDLKDTQLVSSPSRRCIEFNGAPNIERLISNGVYYYIYYQLSARDPTLPRRSDHWYMAQLYHYYLRPNEELRQYKAQLIKNAFPDFDPSKTISAHIRRGDHWMGEHLGNSAYLASIRAIAKATNAHTLFLGTDDMELYDTFPKLLAEDGLKVIYIPANYSILGQHRENCVGMSKSCTAAKMLLKVGSSDEGMVLMSQILLMADTLVSIGTIGSNYGRVIHQMQWSDKSLRSSKANPMVSFFDMSGDQYFACGWRKSGHVTRGNGEALKEWVNRYHYVKKRYADIN